MGVSSNWQPIVAAQASSLVQNRSLTMKRRRRLMWVGGAATLALASFAACGGDDNVGGVSGDAGSEGGGGDASLGDYSIFDSGANDSGTDASSDAGRGRTLDGGVCNGGVVSVASITPNFGWTGGKTSIAIGGTGFQSTPTVFLESEVDGSAGGL